MATYNGVEDNSECTEKVRILKEAGGDAEIAGLGTTVGTEAMTEVLDYLKDVVEAWGVALVSGAAREPTRGGAWVRVL